MNNLGSELNIDYFREIGRKVIHICFGLIIIFLFYYNVSTIYFFYLLIFSVFLGILNKKIKIPIITFFVKNFGRSNEKQIPGKGFILFLIGAILTIQLFDYTTAMVSLIILTFGDSFSHLFTILTPKSKIPHLIKYKTYFGVFMSISICSGILCFFLNMNLIVSFIVSFVSLIIEIFQVKIEDSVLDDNVLIPLVSGTTILLLKKFALFLFM